MASTLSRGVQAQKLSVAVDEAKCVITEVIRVMNLEWLLPTYKHVTFIAALHAVRKLQREQHIPSSSTIFIRFSKEGNFSDVRKKFENGVFMYLPVCASAFVCEKKRIQNYFQICPQEPALTSVSRKLKKKWKVKKVRPSL